MTHYVQLTFIHISIHVLIKLTVYFRYLDTAFVTFVIWAAFIMYISYLYNKNS